MIEQKVKQTIKKIKLNKSEKILVALSGGKDSATTAYFLKKFGYNIEAIHLDLKIGKYSEECLKAVEELCKQLDIKLHVYDFEKKQKKSMKYFWEKNKTLNHCAVCGVFKKWILNKEARRLKVSKIATGHNLDDEVETCLLNVFKGSPNLNSSSGVITQNISDKKFVPRIKPLFFCENKQIKKYAKKNKIVFVDKICPYRQESYRVEIRKFVDKLTIKDKNNILKNFEKMFIKNQKKYKIQYCKICGEPSRNDICKKCELMR